MALMLEKRAVLAKLALGCRSVGHPRVQKFAAMLVAKTKHCRDAREGARPLGDWTARTLPGHSTFASVSGIEIVAARMRTDGVEHNFQCSIGQCTLYVYTPTIAI